MGRLTGPQHLDRMQPHEGAVVIESYAARWLRSEARYGFEYGSRGPFQRLLATEVGCYRERPMCPAELSPYRARDAQVVVAQDALHVRVRIAHLQ